MNILALSHSCVSDVNQQLFVALNRLPDTRVALIVPANWVSDITGQPQTSARLPAVDFPVYRLPVWKPGHVSLHCYRDLSPGRFRAFQPDILLSSQEPWSLSHAQAVGLAHRLGIPVVFQTNQNIRKQYPPPFGWLEQRAYRTAAAALAYSEEARQVLGDKGFDRPAHVVPYGVDLTLFHPGDSRERRRELGLTGGLVLGYIGRFVQEKGLDMLIEAAARLSESPGLDIQVLLVGTGPGEERLKAQVARAGLTGRFVFTGSVPHAQAGEYLRCMDLFVLPSRTTPFWKEQFGRVIIEAMACEIPVVGSDSGAIPGLIRTLGGGCVFREGDPADLSRTLSALVQNPEGRRRLGRAGARSVRAHYTFEAVASQTHEILSGILSPQSAGREAQAVR